MVHRIPGLCTLLATVVWLGGCTWTVDMRSEEGETDAASPDEFFVEAELFYPERVALPGDAEMLVAVDAVGENGRRSLTRFSTNLDGRQVPIPLGFSVQPEDDRPAVYELSAAVLSGKRLLKLTGPVLVMPEEGRARLGTVELHAPLETGFGQAWRCGGTTVMFGAVDDRFFLSVDRQVHPVEPVPAASGARYRSLIDPAIAFHEKSGEIVLIRGGETETGCRRVEALGPPLSGGGNEPGWHVEIEDNRIVLTSDYGQTVTEAALMRTGSSGLTTRFRGLGEHGPILAAFDRTLCRDSATGMPHPYTVKAQFEDGALNGCGGEPRDLLVSKAWRVVRLDDEAVPESLDDKQEIEITLGFDSDGRLGGRAACNRYTAGYQLSGEGLSIDQTAATKMACGATLMDLERRFLERLAGIERFDIGEDGELILIGSAGRITAVDQGL